MINTLKTIQRIPGVHGFVGGIARYILWKQPFDDIDIIGHIDFTQLPLGSSNAIGNYEGTVSDFVYQGKNYHVSPPKQEDDIDFTRIPWQTIQGINIPTAEWLLNNISPKKSINLYQFLLSSKIYKLEDIHLLKSQSRRNEWATAWLQLTGRDDMIPYLQKLIYKKV